MLDEARDVEFLPGATISLAVFRRRPGRARASRYAFVHERGIAQTEGAGDEQGGARAILLADQDQTALPVETGGTEFQREVWRALRAIPAGETRSYGALASSIGRASAVRAVGLANGANPIGVVVPCHRVIGQNGALTGYAGGIERKRWLLAHEGTG